MGLAQRDKDGFNAMAENTEQTSKVGAKEALARIVERLRKVENNLKTLDAENRDLREQLLRDRRQMGEVTTGLFVQMGWEIDNFESVPEGDVDYEAARQYAKLFMGYQASIAPEMFRRYYGIDPITGEAVGPGRATTGEIIEGSLDPRNYEVDAAEAGRRAMEDGAMDNGQA